MKQLLLLFFMLSFAYSSSCEISDNEIMKEINSFEGNSWNETSPKLKKFIKTDAINYINDYPKCIENFYISLNKLHINPDTAITQFPLDSMLVHYLYIKYLENKNDVKNALNIYQKIANTISWQINQKNDMIGFIHLFVTQSTFLENIENSLNTGLYNEHKTSLISYIKNFIPNDLELLKQSAKVDRKISVNQSKISHEKEREKFLPNVMLMFGRPFTSIPIFDLDLTSIALLLPNTYWDIDKTMEISLQYMYDDINKSCKINNEHDLKRYIQEFKEFREEVYTVDTVNYANAFYLPYKVFDADTYFAKLIFVMSNFKLASIVLEFKELIKSKENFLEKYAK